MFNIEYTQGPLSREERIIAADNGQILPEEVDGDMYDNVYAWKLKDVVKFENSIEYKHPSGAVIWVTMTETDKENIEQAMEQSKPRRRIRM